MAVCHTLWAVGRQHHLTLRRDKETSEGEEGQDRLEVALGHVFKDRGLVQAALTHASA